MSIEYKKLRMELNNTKAELEHIKNSYRELLSKFGGKEIQTRGYRLALNNSNELLYEVIHQIEGSIPNTAMPLQKFINSMNVKIMKLLENSTKELQTLTDINPQSCLTEFENENKDPIEDAFAHLRSLLTFQTALKRSAAYCVSTESSDIRDKSPRNTSIEWNQTLTSKNRQGSKTSGGSLHFSEISESTMKDSSEMQPNDYIFRRGTPTASYAMMHTSRSTSREQHRKKQPSKIYSQLLTSRNSQVSRLGTPTLSYSKKMTRKEVSPKSKKIYRKSSISDPKTSRVKKKERDISCNLAFSKRRK